MSLLAAGASILGGLLGRSKTKPISAGDNAYSHVEGIMRAAQTFGWSPLTLMGSVSPVGGTPGTTDNSAFGQGIANAGMILSDRMSAKQTQKAKLEKINQTQTRLQNRLDAITIRTPRPGVYGRARIPADPEVYGALADRQTGAALPRSGPAGGPAASVGSVTPYPADARREQDVIKTVNDAGVAVVDNPNIHNRPFPVPAFNGEILELGQAAVLGASMLYDRAKQRAERKASNRKSMTVAEPLMIPFGFGPSRTAELLPGRTTKPKPKANVRYGVDWVQ